MDHEISSSQLGEGLVGGIGHVCNYLMELKSKPID